MVEANVSWDIRGLSTDQKPVNVPNGSSFLEMDTGKVYVWDRQNQQWKEI